ncbi:hypothetical protein BAUCODRAFT_78650 [Baudoinia panamericana UAMH 10762]|uniref:DUF221-domain-containing protein n=1 Tax=Baudoinia panamericana (strain UAMH 10762) TaxID=717646 RepID=M2N0P5_BAUPA|nr:uncharacterized protein BAUCODRAFT_78650 [Baudoinia panamericana UAMH 10762]EMC92200.1 hypothetical protein BAUCODRAFT_78650 [Baudoinia panamericana UAMH 10762]
MSSPPQPTCSSSSFLDAFNCGAGTALQSQSITAKAFLAAVAGSLVSFGVQTLIFLLLRRRLSRIYGPKSFLVPERERVPAPPKGVIRWLEPLFTTPNLAVIQKCGLDAYFFLRYLRMLLKFFAPVAMILLPILLPLNRYSGGSSNGLDRLSISNVAPAYVGSRLWAHLIMAIGVIMWFCYVVYKEMRGYIRVRQAFLTSPQHRIRASATTVLVTGIPRKWLTLEALSGLYDVFPGGIKNIWINRNFDELANKVKMRDKYAKQLESAETNLIKLCLKKHEKEKAKKEGRKKQTKQQRKQTIHDEDTAAQRMAQGRGISAGDQHDTPHGLQDILHEEQEHEEKQHEHELEKRRHKAPVPFAIMSQGLDKVRLGAVNQGLDVVGHGLGALTKGVGALGQRVVGDVDAGLRRVGHDFDETTEAANRGFGNGFASPKSETTVGGPDIHVTRPSVESKPRSQMQIEEPPPLPPRHMTWKLWKNNDKSLELPSPQPHTADEDEFPLNASAVKANIPAQDPAKRQDSGFSSSKWVEKLTFWKNGNEAAKPDYPTAIDKEYDEDKGGEPLWRVYIEQKDRETARLPVFSWFISLPLIGKKVDKIYWLRRELARLNLEIEADQNDVERFPFMNSAFIQFNHQVAAHMACQSLSHHIPQSMAPRLIEISPNDVLWDNMSIKWWERYLRTFIVLAICLGLIVLYAVPVSFTSALSKLDTLGSTIHWLAWVKNLPQVVISIIQGLLPPILLNLILLLVPIIFRLLVKLQGVPTGNMRELGVQMWYFTFLFVQVFFVATLASGLSAFFTTLARQPQEVIKSLASSLPKASDYFYSYLLVQALSSSASTLLQTFTLICWFVFPALFDNTPRAKWQRQTTLTSIQWGSYFPTFTNYAVIGIIYSVISPFILIFMIIIFGLFWIVQRYNVLYVTQFRNDTGGLLFPTAVNQLFTGVYFLELCLIGYFFISTDEQGSAVCIPQAAIMIVALVFTAVYQWQLNQSFSPLFQFLPITLEDEAVIRDEAFAKEQASKFAPLHQGQDGAGDDQDIQDMLEDRERAEEAAGDALSEKDRQTAVEHRRSAHVSTGPTGELSASPSNTDVAHEQAAKPTWKTDRWRTVAPEALNSRQDVEAQHEIGDALYSGFADELEDLTPQERDLLVRYAFQHAALRAKRPVVWIPRDRLGVSDDEIKRAKKMSTVEIPATLDEKTKDKTGMVEKTNIWISNEGTALDGKGKVVFGRNPPDFSNVDLISL